MAVAACLSDNESCRFARIRPHSDGKTGPMGFHTTWQRMLRYAVMAGCVMLAVSVGQMPSAHAYDSDAALEADGALCTRQVTRSERKYGIPQRLLGAIAATETGRYHRGLGVKVPWPWVINVEGKPFFFHTKREAVIAVEKFQAQGISSIDVGCMQVNLRHHPHAFANLSQAFEPSFNVDYAARFLRGHYDETGSWKTAVGRYHSRTPGHAARYVGAVYGQWYGLASNGKIKQEQQQAAVRPPNRYKSYIRMENTGEQKDLNSRDRHVVAAAKPSTPQKDVVTSAARVTKVASRQQSVGSMDISIIRPAASVDKIEATPTTDVSAATSPMVMHREEREKSFTTPKLVSIHADGHHKAEDSRFIRFID